VLLAVPHRMLLHASNPLVVLVSLLVESTTIILISQKSCS
jgi:hypothetical protein